MPQDKRPRLRLVMGAPPTFGAARVLVPSLAYDDALDCFYVDPVSEATEYRVRELPRNFHTHELLDVDASDVDALLSFQRRWGLVTSIDRATLRSDKVGATGDVVATPTKAGPVADVEAANRLIASLEEQHPGFRHAVMYCLAVKGMPRHYPFAPRAEVAASVEYLQNTVRRLVDAAANGFDNWAGIEEMNLRLTVDHIEERLSPYYQMFRVAGIEDEGDKAEPPILPLSIAVLAQMVGDMTSAEGYHVCKHCHRFYVYKRHTAGSFTRNRRSDYCSDICREIAKVKRQNERRKAERHARKAQDEGGQG